jgi:hypothetical protein
MKKITVILGLLLASFGVAISPSQAKAEECSASNPCGTWAVVDNTGLVTNIIVCQPSVCGGSGSWAGKMPSDLPCPGCSLVLQVPADPVTSKPNAGFYNPKPESPSEPDRTVHYSADTQRFSQGTAEAPVPVNKITQYNDGNTLTTLQTTVKSQMITFSPADFKDGEMKFTPVIDDQTGAELYVYQYVYEGLEEVTVESITFDSPKSQEEIIAAIQENNLNLLLTWLNELFSMLGNWVTATP